MNNSNKATAGQITDNPIKTHEAVTQLFAYHYPTYLLERIHQWHTSHVAHCFTEEMAPHDISFLIDDSRILNSLTRMITNAQRSVVIDPREDAEDEE